MTKNTRIDSATEQAEVLQKSMQEIKPPAHVPLLKKDMPFFNSVIEEFARAEWTAHQLELAALLARSMSDMTTEQAKLRKEGYMLKSVKKTKNSEREYFVLNPRKEVVRLYANTILSMRRSLSLHARARADSRDSAGRRAKMKELESGVFNTITDDGDDDLISRPILN